MNASATSFLLNLASFRFDTLGSLLGSGGASSTASDSKASSFELLLGRFSASFQTDAASLGNATAGRNMSLNDPEAAFRMMTDINGREVGWKAQFVELSAMEDSVSALGEAAHALGKLSVDDDNGRILEQVQAFIGQYNKFFDHFVPDLAVDGVLGQTQAAGITLHELEASVRNLLNGSRSGVYGLTDLGVTIDARSRLASLDEEAFKARLENNKEGVVNALKDFADNFAGAAKTVTGDGKFIHRQLDNLDRVLDYLRDNSTSLRLEFGTGAPPKMSEQVAKAVAAYEGMQIS